MIHVEVELNRKPADGPQRHIRGELLKGRLVRIEGAGSPDGGPSATGPALAEGKGEKDTPAAEKSGAENAEPGGAADAEKNAGPKVYVVEIDGKQRRFTPSDKPDDCKEVLLDFEEVGIKALDDYTYQITLDDPTAYFLNILTMFPQYPVNRRCVETYGEREWLEPSHMVTNGPYTLAERRIRERIRLVKSPTYWDRDNVQIGTIDALAVENTTTALNIYLTGKADWITSTPPAIARQLMATPREDYHPRPYFSIEFLKLNVKRPPLDDPRVRRALALAVNKDDIVAGVMCRGEQSGRSLVPPIIRSYMPYLPAQCGARNADEARRMLKEAGYSDRHPLPKLTLLYNTNERLQLLAEVLQRQWKQELGIDIEPQNTEWGAYLQEMRETKYFIGRSGWIGDYVDPNTFLDMFTTGNENNQTNWSNPRYDRLVEAAQHEKDPAVRLRDLHDAEQILMDELPIIPLFVETTNNMIPPYAHGFYENVLDEHPLGRMSIDEAARRRWQETGGRR